MSNRINLKMADEFKQPDVYVVASNALTPHKNLKDAYICNGTDDNTTIQAALNEIRNTKGRIQLSEGTFNLNEALSFPSNSIEFYGRGTATKLVQNSEGTRLIDAEGKYYADIRDLWISMPTTNGEDGIVVGTVPKIMNVRIQGGDTDHYLIKLVQAFNMHIEDITAHGAIGNGIAMVHGTGSYPGNGFVNNIQFSMARNSTGLYIDGYNNLMNFSAINIVTQAAFGKGSGIKGIWLNGADCCTFTQIDLELLDYSIYCTYDEARGVDSSGVGAGNNVFINLFSSAQTCDIYLDEYSGNNTFIQGKVGLNTWKIEDNYPKYLSTRNRFITYPKYIMTLEPIEFVDDFTGYNLGNVWKPTGTVTLANSKANITTEPSTDSTARIDMNGNGGYKDLYESYMEFKANRVSSGNYDVYLGLANTGFANNKHAAYFRALSTDTNWQCCVSGMSCSPTYTAPYTVDSGVEVNTTPHTFKIHSSSLSSGIQFYIDDVWVGDLRHCMPSTIREREPIFEVVTQEDATKTLAVDYIRVIQGRALTP